MTRYVFVCFLLFYFDLLLDDGNLFSLRFCPNLCFCIGLLSRQPQLLAAVKFIAHLVNQLVAHEIIALELLTVLLENPTDDSVEVAVGFVTECGSLLQDLSPKGLHGGYAVGIELLSSACVCDFNIICVFKCNYELYISAISLLFFSFY